jgi:hypothetical protein
LWPKPGESAALLHWGAIAGALGAKPELDKSFLLCVRNVAPFAAADHPMRSVGRYDDTGVIVYRGGTRIFPMSSHAYQVNSKLSPDVDGDGHGDVGTIKPGRYLLRDLHTGKYPTFLVTMPDGGGHIPCWRDTDHDGIISHDESVKAYTATQILVHGGLDDPPDSPHHFSIGCQCVPLEWRRFMVEHSPGGLIDYCLATVEQVLAVVPEPMPDTERPNA